MSDRTFVCRCEDVTFAELEHALAAGLETIEELKRYTGFGTGPCQGKECLATVARELVRRGTVDAARLQPFTARPPSEPVSFAALATIPDPFADPDPSQPSEGLSESPAAGPSREDLSESPRSPAAAGPSREGWT